MKRCLGFAYPLDYMSSTACPERGRRTRAMRAAFLVGWPLAALGYALFLGFFEGIWGDPWYGTWRMTDLNDVRNFLFYPAGSCVVLVTSVGWFWLAVVTTVRCDWRHPRWRTGMLVTLWYYSAIVLGLAGQVIHDVMRTFLSEAFEG